MLLQILIATLIIDLSGNIAGNADTTILVPRENAISIADKYECLTLPCSEAINYAFQNVPESWVEKFKNDGGSIVYIDDIPQLKVGTMGILYSDENKILARDPKAMVHELCHYIYRHTTWTDRLIDLRNSMETEWLSTNGIPASYESYEFEEEVFARALTDYFLTGRSDICRKLVDAITEEM